MRRWSETGRRPWTAASVLAAAIAAAAGCAGRGGGGGETGGGGEGGGGGSDTTGNGGSSSTAAMNVGDTPTAAAVGAACTTSNPAPPILRRLTVAEYAATVRAFLPVDAAAFASMSALSVDPTSKLSFRNDASQLLVAQQSATSLQKTAEAVAAYVTDPSRLANWLPCATAANAACADTFIADFGKRFFRRPLSDAEKQQYRGLHDGVSRQATFALAIKWTLAAMLQSPNMVYRSEIGQKAGATYKLSQHEIAAALAYNFGGGPPDDALLARADRGELSSAAVLVAEAQRQLGTASGRTVLAEMFREWARYDRVWDGATRAPAPDFATTWPVMQQETARFIEEVVVNRMGGVTLLLTAPFTVVNDVLAAYYVGDDAARTRAYGTVPSGTWAVVDRPAAWGVGLLAQGSFVAGHAYGASTSPTQRGLTIYERYLCHDRPRPPDVVPVISPPAPGVRTTRQRYEEAHLQSPGSCPVCHTQFDPPAFALEHFDQAGRYRTTEGGLPIVTTGHLPMPFMSTTFDGQAEMAQALASTPQVANCVGGLLESFVFGGAGGQVCLAAEARQSLISGQTGLLAFIAQLAGSGSFATRTAPAN